LTVQKGSQNGDIPPH